MIKHISLRTKVVRLIYILAITLAVVKANSARIPIDSDDKAIAISITKAAIVYQVDRSLLSCILYVESTYRVNVVSESDDYGIGQINGKTITGYGLDRTRLLTDLQYSVDSAAAVLADFQRHFKAKEPNYWIGRYNIGFRTLSEGNAGAAYVAYNSKVYTCIQLNNYL